MHERCHADPGTEQSDADALSSESTGHNHQIHDSPSTGGSSRNRRRAVLSVPGYARVARLNRFGFVKTTLETTNSQDQSGSTNYSSTTPQRRLNMRNLPPQLDGITGRTPNVTPPFTIEVAGCRAARAEPDGGGPPRADRAD